MITKERQLRKMKNTIRQMHITKSLNDGKNAHKEALDRKIKEQMEKGEARRDFRRKIAKENGVRIERVQLTSRLEKGKATYIIK